MKRLFLLSLVAVAMLSSISHLKAQTVLDVELQEELNLGLLEIIFPFLNVQYPVETYRVVYTSVDAMGEPDTLSGLLSLPVSNDNPQFPITIYNHATIFFESEAPSVPGAQERPIANAFATSGYICIAPDYIGFGVDATEGHPYLHKASQAQAGKDMIIALRDWLTEEGIAFNQQLFTTGYSQGGHASAGLQQILEAENDPDLQVTAAAHLSGGYIVNGGDPFLINSNTPPAVPAFLINRFVGYNLAYGWYDSNAAMFKEPYLSVIDSFTQNLIELNDLDVSLLNLMTENNVGFAAVFQDSLLTILAENDPDNPIVSDIAENNVFAWAPQAPTRLVYCTGDMTVPFSTAIFTDSIMNSLGALDVGTINAGPQEHVPCATPAGIAALNFFSNFAEVLSSTANLTTTDPGWQIAPNPIRSGQTLSLSTNNIAPEDFELFDLFGRLIKSGAIIDNQLEIGELPSGTYLLHLTKSHHRVTRKIVVN
ncbi:MAG: T9SS type A sorting domain-containing protein [Bacteroidota bacterium]